MDLTPDQLLKTVYVIVAVFGVLITVDKGIDIIKKWRAPATDTAQKLANDKGRLDDHEAAIKDLQESGRLQGAALVALLDHELHNGNTKQMEDARDDLLKHYMAK
jgi:hypothetical protein